MIESHIDFQNMEWENPKTGVLQKVHTDGNQIIRLTKFLDTFIEEEWCMKGHAGYVVDGEMKVDFNGVLKHYKKGDGLFIKAGISSKHKAIIENGKHVELILFELEE